VRKGGPMTSTVDVGYILQQGLPKLVEFSGVIGQYCDRADHNEATSPETIREVGWGLRKLAQTIAAELGLDLRSLYAERVARVEAAHILGGQGFFDGGKSIREGTTWHAWQIAQMNHDRVYHPDVAGLPKNSQLSHIGHHIAKLAWRMQQTITSADKRDEFLINRVADLVLFGVKLATVTGQRLPEEPTDS
jgi:hypothetical protein